MLTALTEAASGSVRGTDRFAPLGGDTVVGMMFVGPWTRWLRTTTNDEPVLMPLQRLPVGG